MENNLKDTIKRYISGSTSKAERDNMKDSVSRMSNGELDEILSDIWNEYDGTKEINDFNVILNKIRPRKRIIRMRVIASVAASLLIFTLIGFQIYFYKDNKRLNDFISKDVVMSVESGERSSIILPDGTKVLLNAASTLSYSVDYGLVTREVKLAGEAFVEVVKNTAKPFKLHTEFVGIEVLGTKFNINAYTESDIVEATLIDGSVKLTTKGGKKQAVIMSPNDKAVYNKKTDELSVTKRASTQFETAWLEGKLVFRSAEFKDILKKLEQRYGVEIIVTNMERYNTDLFTGTFAEDYVNGVLRILQLHYNFTYREGDGSISITFK